MQTMTLKLKPNKTVKAALDRLFFDSVICYNRLLALSLESLQNGKVLSHFDLTKIAKYEDLSVNSRIISMLCKRVSVVVSEFAKSQKRASSLAQKLFETGKAESLDAAQKEAVRILKSQRKFRGRPRFKSAVRNRACFSYLVSENTRNACVKIAGKERDYQVLVPKKGRADKNLVVKGRANFVVDAGAEPIEIRFVRDSCGTYWAKIVWDSEPPALPKGSHAVGVDLGLKHTAAYASSDGSVKGVFLNRKFEANLAALRWASKNQRRALPFIHRRIAASRKHGHREFANKLIALSSVIFIGDCSSARWLRSFNGRLARSCADAAHSSLLEILNYKAARAGVEIKEVREAFSSVTCSGCGFKFEKLPLSEREFKCPSCGMHLDRDINAAVNIARLGINKFGCCNSRGVVSSGLSQTCASDTEIPA